MKKVDEVLNSALGKLSPKQKKVVTDRFGFKTGKSATLQKIGNELGVTRERVRQIVEQSTEELKNIIKEEAKELTDFAIRHLQAAGGIRRDDYFLVDIKHNLKDEEDTKHLDQKVRFLLVVNGEPKYYREDEVMKSFWYMDEDARQNFLNFINEMTVFFRAESKKAILEEKKHLEKVGNAAHVHFLSIPKAFGVNVFGDVGLVEWPEIDPKTIRDKIYLALKRHGAPLYFKDIAKYIHSSGISTRPVHMQTVHNELIKDKRFVLVGRGIYALEEHGYNPGTVREIIVDLLKNKGPLTSEEVVNLVNERRFFKENTILLNLQNRKYFKRSEEGRYAVREA